MKLTLKELNRYAEAAKTVARVCGAQNGSVGPNALKQRLSDLVDEHGAEKSASNSDLAALGKAAYALSEFAREMDKVEVSIR